MTTCRCGCGAETRLINRNDTNAGLVKGTYRKFLAGHNNKIPGRVVGSTRVHGSGYVLEWVGFDHPMADRFGWALQHRLVASRMVDRIPLPKKWVVHHENEDATDNRPENLRIFATAGLHKRWHLFLHYRVRGGAAYGA